MGAKVQEKIVLTGLLKKLSVAVLISENGVFQYGFIVEGIVSLNVFFR
jgi:hypothetical protein